MQRGFKIRIYPTKIQKRMIDRNIGNSRFVYNHFLALKIESYDELKLKISMSDCSSILTNLKKK